MLKLCTVLSKGTALKFVQLSVQHGSGMRDRLVAFDSESSTKEKDQNEKAAAEEEKNEKAEENNEEVPAAAHLWRWMVFRGPSWGICGSRLTG